MDFQPVALARVNRSSGTILGWSSNEYSRISHQFIQKLSCYRPQLLGVFAQVSQQLPFLFSSTRCSPDIRFERVRNQLRHMQYPPSCCTTDHSGRLPTTSPTLAFTAGFIFEPTRTQVRVWAELSAQQSTRTTCPPNTMTTGMMTE